jgi:hypothetical protein
MIGLVFAGSLIGGFVVWPIIRPVFIHDTPAVASAPEQMEPPVYFGGPPQRNGGRQ